MNHPKPEEWVPYLYGDVETQTRRQLARHLRECAECRDEVHAWKRSVHRLDAWKLPANSASSSRLVPVLKWAAAAALVMIAGFGLGRSTASSVNLEQVRSALLPQIREELQQEFASTLRQELNQNTARVLAAADERASRLISASVADWDNKRLEDSQAFYRLVVSLKKDVDTVAVNADAGLRRTEQELVQLTSYPQTMPPLNSIPTP